MIPRMTAFALCLCLASISTGCSAPVVVPSTKLVEVPIVVPQPAACARLRALDLPTGSTAQDVIEAQQAVILQYEAQVRECAR